MIGLRFRETMIGRLAPRAFDPVDGYERVDGVAVAMHIEIDIADVRSFVASKPHDARLRADVVIPVLGGRFTTSGGRFICFEWGEGPLGTPVQQLMYSARLINSDRAYKLSARKVLEPKGWRIWRDTTTLLVTLVDITTDGDDARPRHVAGVVTITLRAFLRGLATMRPYGDAGWFARQREMVRYLSFFAGGLCKTYFRRTPAPNQVGASNRSAADGVADSS